MVARRKNGLEVHSSRLQLPRSESSLEVSEELPEWVQNCICHWYHGRVFHLNYHCPTSTYCKSVSILLLCSLPDILPTSVYLPADQNPHYTIEATMDPFTYLRQHRKYSYVASFRKGGSSEPKELPLNPPLLNVPQ